MEVIKYTEDKKDIWDDFVTSSKNHFIMFYRAYMEYHSDRFTDCSLMIYEKDKLLALLPANIYRDYMLYSHQGLTFGGFVVNTKMTTPVMLTIFEKVLGYLKREGISMLVYKAVPYIYHVVPAEEDRYALFRNDAKLIRRDVTSTISLPNKILFNKNRLRQLKKAKSYGITIRETEDYETYWRILEKNLKDEHNIKPVHTLSEITDLHYNFPTTIRLFSAFHDEEMISGTVLYESKNMVHAQYIATEEEGRKEGALDLLFSYLIPYYTGKKRYFDFGISNEKEGRYLNEGLISFKEGFGARAVTHDFYTL